MSDNNLPGSISIAQLLDELAGRTQLAPYEQLFNNLTELGFRPRIYFDGKPIFAGADYEALIEAQVPITVMWLRDDGQQVIQCAKSDGTTMLFWPTAAEDIQSQLSYLAERFSKPSILGQTSTTGPMDNYSGAGDSTTSGGGQPNAG